MTLEELVALMAVSVDRSDLASSPGYDWFIVEAIKEIQRKRSWRCMREVVSVTATAGQAETNKEFLIARMKELSHEDSPVKLQYSSTGRWVPVRILTEKILRRRVYDDEPLSISYPYLYLVEQDASGTSQIGVLRMLGYPTEDTTIEVDCYRFLDNIVTADDGGYDQDTWQNWFATEHPFMVLEKAKSLAFLTINDPAALDSEAVFEKKFKEAATADAYSQLAGVNLHM